MKQIVRHGSVIVIVVMVTVTFVSGGGGGPMKLGDYCSKDSHCTYDIDNSRCNVTNHECICEDGFYNIRDEGCSTVLNDVNTPCFKDCDCSFYVQNTKCENYVCVCDDGFKATNITCEKDPDYTATAKNVGHVCPCERSGVSRQFSAFSIVVLHVLIFSVTLF